MKWSEKWREKCSEISSRAGGSPAPFFIRASPCVLFEKNQKGLSFSSARRKEPKEASTPTKSPPILGDLTENRGNRRFIRDLVWLSSLCPCGVSHDLLSAGALRKLLQIKTWIIYTIVKTPRGMGCETPKGFLWYNVPYYVNLFRRSQERYQVLCSYTRHQNWQITNDVTKVNIDQ